MSNSKQHIDIYIKAIEVLANLGELSQTTADRTGGYCMICYQEIKRKCYYAVSQFLETTFSQIGGHPTWIQDAEYPKCPTCSQYMKFIGQIDWADIEEYGEGMYYAFVCEECNIAATNYQQS